VKSLLAAIVLACASVPWLAVRTAEAQPGANPLRGKILFLRCASCHDLSTGPSAKIGPNLRGVLGRKAASLEGYRYSAALRALDFNWDAGHLDAWLTNPNAVAPGTAMAFAGIPDAAERQAIIAYLDSPRDGGSP
jgi:cytochrome c